jgi:hypothetical protein
MRGSNQRSFGVKLASIILLAASGFAGVASSQVPNIPTSRPRILLVGAELQRLQADNAANTAAAVRFRNMVNSAVGGSNIYAYQPWYSAMMGVITGQANYCTDAVTRIDAFLDEEVMKIQNRAGANPINPDIPPPMAAADSYLEIGDAVGNVALVYDWCYSATNATQRLRWGNYADRFTTNVWDQDNAQWGIPTAGNNYSWSGIAKPQNGWSVDNPFNNYYYSFLRATMLWGIAAKHDRPSADGFLTMFRTTKLQNQLVPAFTAQLVGGGSREGTGYGTAMRGLFGLYHIWEKTTGERIADLTSHAQSTMPYMIHAISPMRDRLAPIGDHARDETAAFYDYHRDMLLALSSIYSGTPMSNRVRAFLAASSRPQMGDQFNWVYDYLYAGATGATQTDLNTSYLAQGTGHFYTRSSWNTNATWLTFLTGAYTESHAHQDGLSLMLFKNGWLVNDANMTAHSGIFQGQEAHGLVTQRVGGEIVRMYENPNSSATLRALATKDDYTYASATQGTLFNHPSTGNPGVRSDREVVHIKPDVVVVFDRVEYTPGSSIKTFQLPIPGLPTIAGRVATYSNGTSQLKVHAVSPASSTLAVTTMSTVDSDFQGGYRFDASVTGSGLSRFLHVLNVDNAAATVAQGANEGEVVINLANGKQITLRFNLTTPGGSIEIRSSVGGPVTLSETLAATVTVPPVTNAVARMATDFNGDNRSDVLWHNSATGMLYEMQMNGTAVGSTAVIDQETDLNWKVAAVADLNNDARADVVWQNNATGQVYGLLMNGTTVASEGTIYVEPNTSWKIVGAGDFNGDGNADLLWKNNTTGDVFLLLLNGLNVVSGGVIYSEPNTNWQIQKVADFNGDGRADIVWRNTATGDVYMMLMNGTTVIGGGVIYSEPNTAWQIQTAADFNGDGRADVLWRNTTTGDVYMMLMNGTTITGGSVFYGEPNAAWKIVASGDYNGDNRADILWRNTSTGQVFMMLMNGFTISSGGFVYTEPDQNWKILGP